MVTSMRLRRLAERILELGPGEGHWPWLQKKNGTIIRPLSKRGANKFIARVGEAGHSSFGDYRHIAACERIQNRAEFIQLVVFVV